MSNGNEHNQLSNENKLDVLIVENITDIEQAYERANTTIEEKLSKGVSRIFKNVSKEYELEWSDSGKLGDCWIAKKEWISNSDNKNASYDLKIYFDTISTEMSYLGNFLSLKDNSTGLFLWSETHWNGGWKRLQTNTSFTKIFEELKCIGFLTLDSGASLGLPTFIIQETLAKGFEEGDLSKALDPIKKGLTKVLEAHDVLDKFVKLIRENIQKVTS